MRTDVRGGGDPTIKMSWKMKVGRGEAFMLNMYLIFIIIFH